MKIWKGNSIREVISAILNENGRVAYYLTAII